MSLYYPDLLHGFIESFLVVFVSEFGDNTFFITAIMSMKHSRISVLMGSLTSLFVMNFLSVVVGYATSIIPRSFISYASSVSFTLFGFKMLQEGWRMSADKAQEEYEEAEEFLQNWKEKEKASASQGTPVFKKYMTSAILSTVFIQTFSMTFLAEWGDRSQIATIILGAKENILGVILGSFIGNALCTCLAVIGGRLVAQKVSIRKVTFLGGALFLFFALSPFIIDDD